MACLICGGLLVFRQGNRLDLIIAAGRVTIEPVADVFPLDHLAEDERISTKLSFYV